MLTFSYLDKRQKGQYLPLLFDLLYDNMRAIAPSDLSYEEEKSAWLCNVSPALEQGPRQMLLCHSDSQLAGFVMFYTRDDLLMVEELQLKERFHRSFAFYHLCRYLAFCLPQGIRVIEAYALQNNRYSQKLMEKLGMEQLEVENGYVHLRGDLDTLCARLRLSCN